MILRPARTGPILPRPILLAVLVSAALPALVAPSSQAQTVPAPSAARPGPPQFQTYAPASTEVRISNFSGLQVPRYSSLRAEEVNGRAGPSPDYPVKWVYHRAGLPVVVIRESEDWRKIRDPAGDEVWVHKSLLAAERTVAATHNGAIRRDADARSATVAIYAPGAVMALQDCSGDWCRVEAEGRRGWAPRLHLWGVDPLPERP